MYKGRSANAEKLILSDDSLQLTQLDKLLWTFSSVSFVPHCFVDSKLSPVTPIVLGSPSHLYPESLDYTILLSFHDEVLPYYQRFNRVIEIVDHTPADREKAFQGIVLYQREPMHMTRFAEIYTTLDTRLEQNLDTLISASFNESTAVAKLAKLA